VAVFWRRRRVARLGNPDAVDIKVYDATGKETFDWRARSGRMKCEEAKRLKHLKHLEDENRRLKQLVADQALDIQMLKHLSEGNW
jgi:hypothetical protein